MQKGDLGGKSIVIWEKRKKMVDLNRHEKRIRMRIFRRRQVRVNALVTEEQKRYRVLASSATSIGMSEHGDLGENMEVVNMLFIDHWKPHYLLNHNTKCAYEFMNENACLVGVSDTDIDWDSLDGIPKEYLYRIETRNALFPTFIGRFSNGVAKVCWQINPDGRYWMDEDGFGMTPDVEFNIYGYIDSACKVIVPFQAVKDPVRLEEMKALAEKIVAERGDGRRNIGR